jgi:phytoene dehydrogenase-like protein
LVLFGHGGIFALPAHRLSFHAYAAGTLCYHRGCYYPKNDMGGFVSALADTIKRYNGRVFRNRRVVSAKATSGTIDHVKTQSAETFAADAVVVNFDPKTFLDLVDKSASGYASQLPAYRYSATVTSLFLGVTDARVLLPRFGNWNIWYRAGIEQTSDPYDTGPGDVTTSVYVNCPTLIKGLNTDAPPGHATVTAFAPASYWAWKNAAPETLRIDREKHMAMLIDLIDRQFAPGIRDKIGAAALRTPADKERILSVPEGNIYGRRLEPRDVWTRIPFKGVLSNLYFTGAYVSFPGIASVLHGACRLYQELTGDSV